MTGDLNAMADWLLACGVDTVALESTGVYWIPVYEVLEQRGLKVWLVDARQMKYVPDRKSDVQDCQWLQKLMSLGFSRAAFRPDGEVCVQHRGIALARHDRADDGLAGGAHHVAEHLSELDVHLHQCLLHALHPTGLIGQQHVALPGHGAHGGKVLSAKTKRSTNRVRQALKMAAMSLSHSDSALGASTADCAAAWTSQVPTPPPRTSSPGWCTSC